MPRETKLQVRLSTEERMALAKLAEEKGLKISQYARMILLEKLKSTQ